MADSNERHIVALYNGIDALNANRSKQTALFFWDELRSLICVDNFGVPDIVIYPESNIRKPNVFAGKQKHSNAEKIVSANYM